MTKKLMSQANIRKPVFAYRSLLKQAITVSALVFAACSYSLVQARDSGAQKTEEGKTGQSQDSKPNATQQKSSTKKEGKKTSEAGGSFKPSEEISEDLPVSFPIDI